ncbi:hypothetical protein QRC92_003275 [Vibrio parahaemolyticus]|uniref:hypothetical protein n=1 Tax=Vibrio parahaemolyticus TaxID=670 RepID=UPI0003FC356A|nr:hypothetical protein [Vibrio parahaemolyticus]KIT29920.1 hypothetical protein H323_20420 [Vibrio parahaemolyticus VP766]EJC6841745.1 hypothetical protein [Vibrio parahaemolyticus]EJC6899635.1 hypothetical protein [Vibrio parahaemolyticus]EJC7050279.1 hypothetical protein [Vibrio parahaemolyticus]EJG0528883.1 hypothetical protein [Vibrio parahaemolyticus]
MFFRKLLFSTAIINATSGCVSYQAQQAATQTVNNTGIVLTNVIAQPCNVAITVASLFYPHAIFMTSVPTQACTTVLR